jgi:putative ABC transport system substrate-binding protein
MTVTIGRRELLVALGGAAATWPLAARAQQPGKLPTIGYLGTTTASAWGPWTAAFVQRLDELGWTEGRTIATEYRWADGRSERFAEIATEFVLLKVDVIVTGGNAAVAAKQATSAIPIVFVLGDPVGTGLIANLARPGGNITGLTNQQPDLAGKRLEILRDLVPSLRRLAIMANVDYPFAVPEVAEVRGAAGTLGLDVVNLEIRRAEDIAPAFESLNGRADALYVVNDALGRRTTADHAWHSGGCRSGRPDLLWTKLSPPVPAYRRLCRQDFAGDETRRHSGREADQIRPRHQ